MNDAIARAAEDIRKGRESLTQIAPIAGRYGLTTIEEAIAVQQACTTHWLGAGRRTTGFKIGLTSAAVRAQMGVDQPDFGVLWSDYAFAPGARIPASRFMQPRAEIEIAFVLGRDITDAEVTMPVLISAIDHVVPAVEIVDSVIRDWKIGLIDTIADNASGGGYVLGDTPRRLDGLDLRLCGAALGLDGAIASTGVGAACMGNPINAALWLCRRMAGLGQPLRAGDLILSGALGPMVDVRAGHVVTAEIQGFPALTFSFGP